MERTRQKQIVEALIVAAAEPITAAKISEITPHVKPAQARALVAELANEYTEQERGFEIWEVAGGYQIRTRQDLSSYVRQLQKERPMRLSRAALETLSVVAYKQPITRAEIENVRGVEVGPVVRSLVDRDLIRIAGHREVPGRPMLYATTKRFLEVFGLKKLEDLPTLREIEELLPAAADDDAAEEVPADAAAEGNDAAEAAAEQGDPQELAEAAEAVIADAAQDASADPAGDATGPEGPGELH